MCASDHVVSCATKAVIVVVLCAVFVDCAIVINDPGVVAGTTIDYKFAGDFLRDDDGVIVILTVDVGLSPVISCFDVIIAVSAMDLLRSCW